MIGVVISLLPVFAISSAIPLPLLPGEVILPEQPRLKESSKDAFERVDRNDDNIMTFDEFLHLDLVYETAKKEEYNALDLDNDGKVTREEYEKNMKDGQKARDASRAQYFGEIFEEFDEDFDLSLNEEEVKKILRDRFFVVPRDNFHKIFSSFDADNSKGLSLFEYVNFDANFPFDQTDLLPAQTQTSPEPKHSKPVFRTEFPF